jgi:DNA-binding IclR family transcriptional regulator
MRDNEQVPAVGRALRLLRLLASRPMALPAARIAAELQLPRSSVYHLLAALEREGAVVHLPEQRAWTLGVTVFELGSAYLRHDPLERLAEPLLTRLVAEVGATAHLGILHGRETLYLLKVVAPGAPALVTGVGVRLPASLTAVGRAILSTLPRSQVRALFPDEGTFVNRTGRGPTTPGELRRLLDQERRQGYAVEDGFIAEGLGSVAAAAHDAAGRPVAAIGVTLPLDGPGDISTVAEAVVAAAGRLTRRLGGPHRT